MTNKEFDEKYVGDNIRVHCPTKALNDEFISLATSFGHKVTDYWYDERSQTCYNVGCDRYCNIAWFLADGCDVVEFKSEGLKRLLKVGRVVELRDGTMGFLLEDRILYSEGWDDEDSVSFYVFDYEYDNEEPYEVGSGVFVSFDDNTFIIGVNKQEEYYG